MKYLAKMTLLNNPHYIFFGTPEFAATVLEGLLGAGMAPVAIVTNPDRPQGRKKIVTASAVKLFTIHHSLSTPVLQPEILDNAFIAELKELGAEVGVLAAYGKIVPRAIFDIFPKGIVVVHPSLLPRYPGATPIQSAILAGEDVTGTTLFVMDEKVDHGPVLGVSHIPLLDSDTYTTLADKLAEASAELLAQVLPKYLSGEATPVAQSEDGVTYTKKFTSEDGFVDLTKTAPEVVWRMVRALNPEPGVWTTQDGKRMKILAADYTNGTLVIRKFQFEGGLPHDIH